MSFLVNSEVVVRTHAACRSPQDVVDRRLISNVLVQYLQKGKSLEVLALLAKILNMSSEEKAAIGLRPKPGSGLLGMLTSLPAPEISAEEVEKSNLVELWVSFLEKETAS